jgi:HK97 gp10 family phage protein
MNKVTMTLTGMEPLQRAIRDAPEAVRRLTSGVVARTTFSTAQRARAGAPRETGALRAAIEAKSRGLSGRVDIAAGEFYGRRPEIYWFFVEYGTETVPARPFLRPAAEAESAAFLDEIRRVGKTLERSFASGRLL